MKKYLLLLAVLCAVQFAASAASDKGFGTIRNDVFRLTTEGKPIYSQGGGIFKFTDPRDGRQKYFWYGVHYKEAELYAASPVKKYSGNNFVGISLYTSEDFVNWKEESEVMVAADLQTGGRQRVGWVGRMGVAYVAETGDFALCVQHNNSVLIARSNSPLGPFKPYRHIDMTSRIGTPNTGDQTVFTDEDTGKSYLIYSYGRGRARAYVSEIGVEAATDSLGLKNCVEIFAGAGREGNCMFKRGGRYYLYASNLYGWDCSYAYYLVADDIYGPYRPEGKEMAITPGCEKDYAHVTQTGFFYTLRTESGKETVIYCGDRWADFANNGLGYNQWVPMEFDTDGNPIFLSLSEWQLNAKTGEWKVGKGNNYVLNGSFDADRRIIPLANKPRQEFLLGWDTEIISGNKVGVGLPDSPQLNRENSSEDNATVIGKLALNISDKVPFERRVSQLVESSDLIPLSDGRYILSATVRVSGEFSSLEMFAEGKKNFSKDLASTPSGWQRVSFPITVKGGSVRVGFHAVGSANASCQVDDITLVKAK